MTLKCKDFLFFSLGDLKLTVNHLCACLFIRQGTLRIGIIAEKTSQKQLPCPIQNLWNSHNVSMASVPLGNTENARQLPNRARETRDLFSKSCNNHALSFIPMLIIFLLGEGFFPTQTIVLLPTCYFTRPTRKEGANWHKLHSEIHARCPYLI